MGRFLRQIVIAALLLFSIAGFCFYAGCSSYPRISPLDESIIPSAVRTRVEEKLKRSSFSSTVEKPRYYVFEGDGDKHIVIAVAKTSKDDLLMCFGAVKEEIDAKGQPMWSGDLWADTALGKRQWGYAHATLDDAFVVAPGRPYSVGWVRNPAAAKVEMTYYDKKFTGKIKNSFFWIGPHDLVNEWKSVRFVVYDKNGKVLYELDLDQRQKPMTSF